MIYCCNSAPSNVSPSPHTDHPITLFCQFFVPSSPHRLAELQYCLRKNAENAHISRIIMLNERIYTDEELGVSSPKIVQKNIGKRMYYDDAIRYVNDPAHEVFGYYAIINTDIFFDETVAQLRHCDMHASRKMWALLRWEYDPQKEADIRPTGDSQDVWIFHTNNAITPRGEKILRFPMGVPGCDNKMVYAAHILGFEIVNEPNTVKTWHYHTSDVRTYTGENRVSRPYGIVYPQGYDARKFTHFAKMDDLSIYDNTKLFEYLTKKHSQKRKYIVSRTTSVEANLMYLVHTYQDAIQRNYSPESYEKLEEKISTQMALLKKYAGVLLPNMEHTNAFCANYWASFENSEMFCVWSKYDANMNTQKADTVICEHNNQKQFIWGGVMDVFHYVYATPWTTALAKKKILLIAPFVDTLNAQILIREKIYGVDLFPDCEFVVLPSPAKYGDNFSKGFLVEAKEMCRQIDKIHKQYDVALVCAGGYSAHLANYIYDCGKSAIVVGDALLMYFGIYDDRLLRERSDIFRVYLNPYWVNVRSLDTSNICEFPYW